MKTEKLTLENGLRLVLVPQPGSFAATVLILVEAGSEYETKNINGISHFLEHLMFKGTKKRPEPGRISRELDGMGAEYNAFTSNEHTGYWAKAEAHKLPKVLDLVSDLFLNPIFNEAEIDKERGVIIEELNMDEDSPMRHIHDLFSALMFGDQPAGWDVGGKKEIIRKLTRQQFMDYRAKHYIAPATTVVVAGKYNRKQVVKYVLAQFGGLPKSEKQKKSK